MNIDTKKKIIRIINDYKINLIIVKCCSDKRGEKELEWFVNKDTLYLIIPYAKDSQFTDSLQKLANIKRIEIEIYDCDGGGGYKEKSRSFDYVAKKNKKKTINIPVYHAGRILYKRVIRKNKKS